MNRPPKHDVKAQKRKGSKKKPYQGLLDRVAVNTRRLRAERGWTQEDAAEACDLYVTLYRVIEGGHSNLTASTVHHICVGFGVDVAELFKPAGPLVKRRRGRPPKRSVELAALHGAEDKPKAT